jgi:TPR repeat protein
MVSVAKSDFEAGVDAYTRGDFYTAEKEWRPLAAAGDADAARNLGRLYHLGHGVTQDFKMARYWYEIAARKCNATAQNNLGLLLQDGLGGEKDAPGAYRLFLMAARQGLFAHADAMSNLGRLYLLGDGTQTNIVEAYKWFLLHNEYTIDLKNRETIKAILPAIESLLTPTQKAEALRRAAQFRPQPCKPQ